MGAASRTGGTTTADPSTPTPSGRRALVIWLPDWPVAVARASRGLAPEGSLVVVDRGIVIACSAEARAEGVKRGLRVREAQLRSPDTIICAHDPLADARAFEPVLTLIEGVIPGVQPLRPGLCAVRARGAARYYGGERQAAEALLTALDAGGHTAAVGIADGIFAAEHAVWLTPGRDRIAIVPPAASAAFLARLPIEALGDDSLSPLLRKLGARTLGDFATLSEHDVRARFGESGVAARRRAAGDDPRVVTARVPPRELDSAIEFEPPLDRVDQIAFGLRVAVDEFTARLTAARLVCTGIRVTIRDDDGRESDREWSHPHHFTAADIIDRVRWQLQGSSGADSGPERPIARVHIAPERVDAIGNHEEGLWGQAADERVHHGLSRIQSMLGHEAVLTATHGGGRMLAERRILVPWGDAPPAEAAVSASRPWPGLPPDPQPATVYLSPLPATVLDGDGRPVDVDKRGRFSADPAWFGPGPPEGRPKPRRVIAWAGPWPLRQRWWDQARSRKAERLQLLDDTGDAWLLLHENTAWWLEARYD